MRRIAALLFIFLSTVSTFAQGANAAAETKLSPAEQTMAQARKLIDKNPKDFEAYNALALALSRRARETSDVKFYTQAEEALKKSFEISPDNFDGRRIHVWLLLGKHEFAAALQEAKKLNKKMPDDVMVYGFLTDANVELGNYQDAEVAAQWMLDLRPGGLPGLTRAAYLRELYGDTEGALQLMNMAYQSTPPSEVEDGAWILTQMAHLNLATGKTGEAESLLQQALVKFPGYHYALGNLAKARIAQGRYYEAVTLLRQRYQAAPHAENLYDLAEALELADNSNRELIFYYADHAHQPAKALDIAQQEYARRHDVYTLDAYAWALHVNRQDADARKHIETALAVGIRDAKIFRHAGEITLQLGDRSAAERYLQNSVALHAPGSEQARTALAALTSAAVNK